MRIAHVQSLLITACLFGCSAMPAAPPISGGGTPPPGAPPVASVAAPSPKDTEKTASAEATGNMWGDKIGDSFGQGGLGLTGTGKGGGGTGEGTIGLGGVGTLGHGAGTGSGQGYGSGAGRLGGSERSGARGSVAGATATTTGSGLAPEGIQRVIKRHVAKIRFCYEKAMDRAPALSGKIAVSFTIDGQGGVASVKASDTTIADAEMVTCVLDAVKSMAFPTPDGGGAVNVVYPFVFSPADS